METTEKKVLHTPGPWEIRYGSGIDMFIIAEDFGRVCEIEGPKSVEAMDEWEPVFRANAKLIAAAPDMLEALQMALVELRAAHSLTQWVSNDMRKMAESQIKQIEDAIKKATE